MRNDGIEIPCAHSDASEGEQDFWSRLVVSPEFGEELLGLIASRNDMSMSGSTVTQSQDKPQDSALL